MKTFEGSESIKTGGESWIILPMYLLRALAVILILLFSLFMVLRSMGGFNFGFLEYLLDKWVVGLSAVLLLFVIQLIVSIWRMRSGSRRRNIVELIVGYALPLLCIVGVFYIAHSAGLM